MSKRTLGFRLLALVLALTFTNAVAVGAAVHSCPTHDAVQSAPAAAPHHTAAHTGHETTKPPSHNHGCSCLGSCCTAAVAQISLTPRFAYADALQVAPLFAGSDHDQPARVLYLLPFANGPPSLHA